MTGPLEDVNPLEHEARRGRTRNRPRVAQEPLVEQRTIARIVLERGEHAGDGNALGDLTEPAHAWKPLVVGHETPPARRVLIPDSDEEVDHVGAEDAPDDQAERIGVSVERPLRGPRQPAVR